MSRLLLTGLLSLAAFAGIAGTAAVSAHEPQLSGIHDRDRDHRHRDRDHYRRYEVYYRVRHHDHSHWRFYGSYRTDWEAHRAERMLEHRGYQARVQHPQRRFPGDR